MNHLGFKGTMGLCCSLRTLKLDSDFLKWKLGLADNHKTDDHKLQNEVMTFAMLGKKPFFFFFFDSRSQVCDLGPDEIKDFPECGTAFYDS